MWLRPFASAAAIGCDLGERFIRLSQTPPRNGRADRAPFAEAAVPPEARASAERYRLHAVQAIRRMLREGEFVGRDVVACAPEANVTYAGAKLAPMSPDESASAVQWQASRVLGAPAETIRSGFLMTAEVETAGKTRLEGVFMAMETRHAEERALLLEEAGLTPTAIDSASCALARGAHHVLCAAGQAAGRMAGEPAWLALAHVGQAHTLVVLAEGDQTRFVKKLPLGMSRVAERLALVKGISEPEAFALADRAMADQTCDPDADAATSEAVDSIGREIGKEINYCVQHCRRALPGLLDPGVIVAGDHLPEALAGIVAQAARLPNLADRLSNGSPHPQLGRLIVHGLSHYESASVLMEAAR
ncbi:MAG: hypothetical protein NTW19_21420 [Planctomycetota bacterium]|nr:hypothetical protein [Planctomycetota bacterium]